MKSASGHLYRLASTYSYTGRVAVSSGTSWPVVECSFLLMPSHCVKGWPSLSRAGMRLLQVSSASASTMLWKLRMTGMGRLGVATVRKCHCR